MTNIPPKITARFKHKTADDNFHLDVNLELPNQGVTAIFGRSGAGKTSLLRCMAGLERTPYGVMRLGGEVWQDENIFSPTYKRSIGYVFQEASLFSHLTAQGNLAYAQKRATGSSVVEFDTIVELMGIKKLLKQYPAELSGGERQRVAIARALLINPALLLMDEPLASLDEARKQEILNYLERLRNEVKIPIIYVSHSMNEVARLADYLVVLDDGKVVAQGVIDDVVSRLDMPLKLGEDVGVVIHAQITERDDKWHLAKAEFKGGSLWIADENDHTGKNIRMRILARDVSLALQKSDTDSSILNGLSAQITNIKQDDHSAMKLVQLQVGQQFIIARITAKSAAQLKLKISSQIWAQVKSVSVIR